MKISIITINYNNSSGLERTIQSVIGQTYKEMEHIIVDGGSNDGSADVLKKYRESFAHCISEQDHGIYHAMNKGVRLAKGKYILFLNSGDRFVSDGIVAAIIQELNGDAFVYGNGIREAKNGSQTVVDIPGDLKLEYFSGNSLFHPSVFIRADMFDKYGLHDENLKIVGDWEFFMKSIMVGGEIARKISVAISVMEDDGISRKPEFREVLHREIELVLNRYFPKSVQALIKDYKRLLGQQERTKPTLAGRLARKILGK